MVVALAFSLLYFYFLVQVLAYDAGLLPLFNDHSVCAVPPGLVSSDGCDDVCLLTACCTDWIKNGPDPVPPVTLQSGAVVDCADVVCPNVCRMACDRTNSGGESCDSVCASSISTEAYVFVRRFGAHGFGHVGFGFKVASNLFVYGAQEDPNGSPHIDSGEDNGFWLRDGTFNDMLCAMKSPPIVGADPYDPYYKKYSVPDSPNVCSAVAKAESIYGVGYDLTGNNCLDAVYDILTSYGITDMPLPGRIYNEIPTIAAEIAASGAQTTVEVITANLLLGVPIIWYSNLGFNTGDIITNFVNVVLGIGNPNIVHWAESPFPRNLTCGTPPAVTCTSAISPSAKCSPPTVGM